MTDDIKDAPQSHKKTPKVIDSVSYFPSVFVNDHHAYCARKAERLATAVHVVTSFIAREEPLRTLLRSSSLELTRLSTDRARLIELGPETFATRCAEVAALISTAESANLVSAMNAKLIVEEYARLATFVKERYSFISSHVSDIQDKDNIHQDKGQKDVRQYQTRVSVSVKDSSQTSTRKADILALFSQKDKISIKDAVQSVVGVSEKTIQRDLLSLVAEGVLIKEGERRWSTYKRANAG